MRFSALRAPPTRCARVYNYRQLSPEERSDLIRWRAESGYPRHAPPHDYTLGGWFLISAATYEHQAHFAEEAHRRELWQHLSEELAQAGIECSAWVVLPNHYHLLVRVTELRQVAQPLGRVHGRSSREVNARGGVTGRRVWYRYADRAIRSERHYWTTVNYTHYNPVRHGYTDQAAEWSTSSIQWYLDTWKQEALDELWRSYPLLSYGVGWDD
ncbi:MAG: REP-associated tyrosine transposase [Actinomycetota bacterium]